MITLFPDQIDVFDRTRAALKTKRKVLLQASTGFGKSIVSARMIKGTQEKGRSSWFIVPRRQLIAQMSKNFNDIGIEHGFIADKYPDVSRETCICSLDTLLNRDVPPPDVAFIDEVHYGGQKIERLIERLPNYIVGLSATPLGIGHMFDEMVCGPSTKELIILGRLSQYRYFAPTIPDMKGVRVVGGEYHQGELDQYIEDKPSITGDAIKHYKRSAMGKLNITFCINVKRSKQAAERFCAEGIPSAHVDGDTSDSERTAIFKAYARKELLNLCCADLLIFGFDLEAAAGLPVTVESMSDCTPTYSQTKQLQKWGRTLRRKDHPAIINDHAGNWTRHGLPDDIIEWTLDGQVKREATGRAASLTRCPKCWALFIPRAACPDCGSVREVKDRKIVYREADLKEIKREDVAEKKRIAEDQRKQKAREKKAARTLDELIAFGEKWGYDYPKHWALRQMKIREEYRGKRRN